MNSIAESCVLWNQYGEAPTLVDRKSAKCNGTNTEAHHIDKRVHNTHKASERAKERERKKKRKREQMAHNRNVLPSTDWIPIDEYKSVCKLFSARLQRKQNPLIFRTLWQCAGYVALMLLLVSIHSFDVWSSCSEVHVSVWMCECA